jgi:hypothetical protein
MPLDEQKVLDSKITGGSMPSDEKSLESLMAPYLKEMNRIPIKDRILEYTKNP